MFENVSVQEITGAEAFNFMQEGEALFLDVRTPEEISEIAFDVPHIMYVPMDHIEHHLHEIPKDKTVIVVCRSGHRSLHAAALLVYKEFSKVYNLKNGILKWASDGFPVHHGSAKKD